MKIKYVIMQANGRFHNRNEWGTPEYPPFDSEAEAEEVIGNVFVNNKSATLLWIQKVYINE